MAKCQPGCTCKRHTNSGKCKPGCTCAKHRGREYDPEVTNYSGLHALVRKTRGRAPEHECALKISKNCDEQAEHWATIHDHDGKDIWNDYMPLCIPCHHEYDDTHSHAGFHGRKHSEETKQKMSQTRKGKSWLDSATDEERKEFGARVSEGKSRRSIVPWNKGGVIIGPDGKKMGKNAYEAEVGTPCEI